MIIRRAPSLVYFIQECNLPAISKGNATQPSPFVDRPVPGDKLVFSDFTCTFPVDEDMVNYKEIARWIVGLTFPKQFGQYKALDGSFDGVYSDLTLMILDSNSNPQHVVIFRDAFPVSLSDIQFETKVTDTVIPVVTATFKYTLWEFGDVNDDSLIVTQADKLNS